MEMPKGLVLQRLLQRVLGIKLIRVGTKEYTGGIPIFQETGEAKR